MSMKESNNCKVTVVPLPEHLKNISENASLHDVIQAINAQRQRERAIYLAPSVRWSDSRGSDIEIVEQYVIA